MHKLKFYIPFLYSIETRMSGNIIGIFNWISQYLFPVTLIIWLWGGYINWSIFITILILVYNLYEIGYIQNDTETIKKEKEPTLRLNENAINYYEVHKAYIYIIRFIIGILCSTILIVCLNANYVPIFLSWLIPIIYYVYNNLRNKFIYLMHILLMEIRYVIPIIACIEYFSLFDWIFVLLMYPLPSIIVKLLKKGVINSRFILTYFGSYTSRYLFVLKYYIFNLILFFSLWCIIHRQISFNYLIILMYYSIRAILFYLIFGKKDKMS